MTLSFSRRAARARFFMQKIRVDKRGKSMLLKLGRPGVRKSAGGILSSAIRWDDGIAMQWTDNTIIEWST